MELLAQIIGFIGVLLLVVMFQVNDRNTILRLQVANGLIWTLYYLMMGAHTGAGLVFLGTLRSYLFVWYRQQEWIFPITIIAYSVATLITWKDWTSMVAFAGMILATTALWQKDPRTIRMLLLTVTPFWVTYNYFSGSYFGLAGDLISFSSILIAIWRFDVLPYIRRRRQQTEIIDTADTSLI